MKILKYNDLKFRYITFVNVRSCIQPLTNRHIVIKTTVILHYNTTAILFTLTLPFFLANLKNRTQIHLALKDFNGSALDLLDTCWLFQLFSLNVGEQVVSSRGREICSCYSKQQPLLAKTSMTCLWCQLWALPLTGLSYHVKYISNCSLFCQTVKNDCWRQLQPGTGP